MCWWLWGQNRYLAWKGFYNQHSHKDEYRNLYKMKIKMNIEKTVIRDQ